MVVGGAGGVLSVGVSVQMICNPVQAPVGEALACRGRHGAIEVEILVWLVISVVNEWVAESRILSGDTLELQRERKTTQE